MRQGVADRMQIAAWAPSSRKTEGGLPATRGWLLGADGCSSGSRHSASHSLCEGGSLGGRDFGVRQRAVFLGLLPCPPQLS